MSKNKNLINNLDTYCGRRLWALLAPTMASFFYEGGSIQTTCFFAYF